MTCDDRMFGPASVNVLRSEGGSSGAGNRFNFRLKIHEIRISTPVWSEAMFAAEMRDGGTRL